MGKIKHERQKFHITSTEKKPNTTIKSKNTVEAYKKLPLQLDAVENIFAGINIQLDTINKLNDDIAPPLKAIQDDDKIVQPEKIETQKSETSDKVEVKSKQLSKKEKMRLKHAKLMEKIDVIQQARLQSQKKRQKNKSKQIDQSLLPNRSAIESLLAPAVIKLARNTTVIDGKKIAKNVFAVPSFNDDLPALNSIFKIKPNQNKISQNSKSIAKGKNPKRNFVKNCNLLKKLMAKKRN